MTDQPIYLAIVWHQHQPYYRDTSRAEALMPWVRLHAIKDYYDMPAKLNDFPGIHQTFNLVPSLLKQIRAYESGEMTDDYWVLSEKDPDELSNEERLRILQRFFDANRRNMVDPYPQYRELAALRGEPVEPQSIANFDRQDFLDLQVWFNLTWFDPVFKNNDPFLKSLIEKGKGFTPEEKQQVLAKQIEAIGKVIPVHREMAKTGQIELTTSPFYHPILPLVCNTEVARECMPRDPLPRPFRRPEDALKQIEMGLEYFQETFGFRPNGMWPSEGSVSEQALELIARCGLKWAATDEDILARSLDKSIERDGQGDITKPETLYQPYRLTTSSGNIDLIFRDHFLSDLIGFHYSQTPTKSAVDDFVTRILNVGKKWKTGDRPPLVSVILDGENCWEFYPNDGHDFLDALYERLSSEKNIKCCTVSEYLEEYPAKAELKKVFPGSWIFHNFRVWIGHHEDNRSWDLLNEARETLERAGENGEIAREDLEKAWEELYIAEGSDWNWWYGDDHSSGQDELFDELYRSHLRSIYRHIGQTPPSSLDEAISTGAEQVVVRQPRNFIRPKLDGEITHYYEWQGSGVHEARASGDTMHAVSGPVEILRYGFDLKHFYLCVDTHPEAEELFRQNHRFSVEIHGEKSYRVNFDQPDSYELFEWNSEGWQSVGHSDQLACGRVIELAIPWEKMGLRAQEIFRFVFIVYHDEVVVQSCPRSGGVSVEVPDADFEAKMWLV